MLESRLMTLTTWAKPKSRPCRVELKQIPSTTKIWIIYCLIKFTQVFSIIPTFWVLQHPRD